ncbi:MAG: M55 family metallopeptidase [Halobacteriales archaeon]
MHHLIRTDLEAVVGVDSFTQTRSGDATKAKKDAAMEQLAREVNACIEGIRSVDPGATISVWDQHGSGGLYRDDIEGATYKREGDSIGEYNDADAKYDVGQHAMAGTVNAPLRHTYSSRDVDYYKLNGTFIGEFGARALLAGERDLPTVFLSGDDKACHEAEMFVPEIETVTTKFGAGEEAATHRDVETVLAEIRETAAEAATRHDEIPPFTGFEPPYELIIRYYDPLDDEPTLEEENVERIDPRTIAIRGDALMDVHGAEGRL